MLKLKGCLRCGGDLYMERSQDGTYLVCLQCGNEVEEQSYGKLVPVPVLVETGGGRSAGERRAA